MNPSEAKKREEILLENKQLNFVLQSYRLKDKVLELMQQAQEVAVDEALRNAANYASYGASNVNGKLEAWLNKDSVLSLKSQILEKLT